MFNKSVFLPESTLKLTLLLAIFSFGHVFMYAQDDEPPPPPVPIRTVGVGNGSGLGYGYNDDEDDTKVTGATVRGRIFYEDTNRPARFVSIGLMSEKSEYYDTYSSKQVKTDENGEFVIKNVKPGTYLPFIKSEGVLTPQTIGKNVNDKSDQPFFEKITVSGLGEFQIIVRARRGGAINGRIQYADGEAAVGVKVEVLIKQGSMYANISGSYGDSVGSGETDDRGVYRLTGLPAGTYIVRVNEPFSHSQSKARYSYEREEPGTLLKTYYPEGESPKNAKELEVMMGQEQTAIDITLPERQLYELTGKIVSKKDKQPLENFGVRFFRMNDVESADLSLSLVRNSINANKLGDWVLKNLPKGKYQITVSQNYVYRAKEQTEKAPEYPSLSKEIEITDQNINDIIFEIPTASSLSGMIVMENGKAVPKYMSVYAVEEKTKQAFTSDYNYSEKAEAAEQAAQPKPFRIGKMIGGKYNFGITNNEVYIKSVTFNGRDVTASAVEIGEGEDLSGLRVVLASDLGTVKGKINGFEGGERLFAVALKPDFSMNNIRAYSYGAIVGNNGEFQIKAKPGEYAVILLSEKNRPKDQAELEQTLRRLVENAPKLTVRANEIATITLEMPK